MAPKAARPAPRQPVAGILNPDHEILVRLESGQLTLLNQTAHFNAAVQRQMSRLSSTTEDSRKDTQQMLGQTARRIDSMENLLKIIVALLVLLSGGVLYIGWQLLSPSDKGLAWKGDIPDVPNFLAPGPDEEGIVGLRVRPRNSEDRVSPLGAGMMTERLRSTNADDNRDSGLSASQNRAAQFPPSQRSSQAEDR